MESNDVGLAKRTQQRQYAGKVIYTCTSVEIDNHLIVFVLRQEGHELIQFLLGWDNL